jgi:KEOPS complex subunit Cgi121
MKLVEGLVAIGVDDPPDGATGFEDLDAFVDRLEAIGTEYGCAIQAFDARLVAGREHLESAVEHANRSVAREEGIATDRAVEILCYAAGTRQIDEALTLGVDVGVTPAVIVIDDGHLGVTDDTSAIADGGDETAGATAVEALVAPADTLDRQDEAAIQDVFDISPAERAVTKATLEMLVIERVALLDVEK